MKLLLQKRRNRALTLPEVLVVIATLVILAMMLLPVLAAAQRRSAKIGCISDLKQVNLSFRIWEGDNNNKYPMAVSTTCGGAMETAATGDVANCFLAMSNELSTPKILLCPEDRAKSPATNFGDDFNASHISYFVGVDADEAYPRRIMSGDDNFQVAGVAVPSGLFQLSTNASIAWDSHRHDIVTRMPWLGIPIKHHLVGNLGFADGSVGMFSTPDLRKVLVETALATNRLAIP
jgi:type II secretory pathway pseudopilin PulG